MWGTKPTRTLRAVGPTHARSARCRRRGPHGPQPHTWRSSATGPCINRRECGPQVQQKQKLREEQRVARERAKEVRSNNQPQVLHASTAKLTYNTCLTCPQAETKEAQKQAKVMLAAQVRDPATWTTLQKHGPSHLGLRCNALPEHQMALITSDGAPSRRRRRPRRRLTGRGGRRSWQTRGPSTSRCAFRPAPGPHIDFSFWVFLYGLV